MKERGKHLKKIEMKMMIYKNAFETIIINCLSWKTNIVNQIIHTSNGNYQLYDQNH